VPGGLYRDPQARGGGRTHATPHIVATGNAGNGGRGLLAARVPRPGRRAASRQHHPRPLNPFPTRFGCVYPAWLTRHPGSGGLTEIAIGEGAGVRGHFDTSLECVTVCVEEMKHFVRQARSHHVAAHVLGVDDEANPLFGQYLFEVFGADRVVEIPVANGKADA
jgi:hypothetical protein